MQRIYNIFNLETKKIEFVIKAEDSSNFFIDNFDRKMFYLFDSKSQEIIKIDIYSSNPEPGTLPRHLIHFNSNSWANKNFISVFNVDKNMI
jgi:hypothetical protein